MENFNRMTIRPAGPAFQVFKLNRYQSGRPTDMGQLRFTWAVSPAAKVRFTGTYDDCCKFIEEQGAVFMSEHGIPC